MTRTPFVATLLGLVLAGCAPAGAPAPGGATPTGRADDFLVVDCLLPGQIRQLGTGTTYVSARRAIKTAARDCEIRGGEYTAFDRANYATALRVWLPLAEQGDPAAQTYVGEIFEKGLGVPPDHAAAAAWYRRAAERGYSRAAIDLGNLYEQGLGVPKDPAQALNWYRRAAGLRELAFGAPPASAEELERLRRQVDDLRRELGAKQAELERAQRDLEDTRRALEQRRGETEAERARVADLRRTLQESQGRQQAGSARLRELERAVAESEARLAAKEREVAGLRASATTLDGLRRQAETERGTVARLRQDLADVQRDAQASRSRVRDLERSIGESEARLAAKERELAEVRTSVAGLDERRRQADAERGALVRLRQDLAAVQRDAQAGRARVSELEKSIAERESRLAAKDRELVDLRRAVARLEGESAARRAELERTRQKANGAPPEIQLLEPELIASRDIAAVRAQASGGELTVVGRVASAPGLLSLTVNGREERLDGAGLFKTKVPVRSVEERVRIVAIDRDGRKATLEFLVRERAGKPAAVAAGQGAGVGHPRPRDRVAFGTYHALVIGNNDYKLMRKLSTAVDDALEVARVLEKEYGFRVRLLLNATRYDILSALNELRGRLGDKDNLLIYYAGHGELDQKNQRGHWLPVDAEPDSSANWISNVQVTDVVNAMTVRQLLVVADSCYAGTLTRAALGRLEAGMSEEERLRSMLLMARARSRMVMTSGGVEPVLDTVGGKHSAFAQSFIELLQRNDGVLTGQELFNLLRLRVVTVADRVEARQVPEYSPIRFAGHESGDFFFVRAAN